MKEEDKELLLKDLCARLPYGFVIHRESDNSDIKINDIDEFAHFLEYSDGEEFKPYLCSWSSMTKEERETYNSFFWNHYHDWDGHSTCTECVKFEELPDFLIFCYKHHLDVWGLIPMGLALEATEGMYNKKEIS